MITTITQYLDLAQDSGRNELPIGGLIKSSEARTSAGAFAAISSGTNFIRVASDTNVKLTDAKGNVIFIPAGVPEYLGVHAGQVFTLATV